MYDRRQSRYAHGIQVTHGMEREMEKPVSDHLHECYVLRWRHFSQDMPARRKCKLP